MSDEIDLTSPEVKAAIDAAVSEAVEGLKTKNTELLGKIKKLQAGATITPEDLAAVEAERDEWKGKAQAAEKAAKKAAADAEAANKAKADIDTAYSNSLRDAALTEALTKAGVTNPVHLKAAKALLGAQAEVVDVEGVRTVKAGDKGLGDFITEWAGGDEGKHFVTAPDINGGGSQGGRGAQHTAGQVPAPTGNAEADRAARVKAYNERIAAGEAA